MCSPIMVFSIFGQQMAVEPDLFDCIDSYEHVFAYKTFNTRDGVDSNACKIFFESI